MICFAKLVTDGKRSGDSSVAAVRVFGGGGFGGRHFMVLLSPLAEGDAAKANARK